MEIYVSKLSDECFFRMSTHFKWRTSNLSWSVKNQTINFIILLVICKFSCIPGSSYICIHLLYWMFGIQFHILFIYLFIIEYHSLGLLLCLFFSAIICSMNYIINNLFTFLIIILVSITYKLCYTVYVILLLL